MVMIIMGIVMNITGTVTAIMPIATAIIIMPTATGTATITTGIHTAMQIMDMHTKTIDISTMPAVTIRKTTKKYPSKKRKQLIQQSILQG